MEKMKTYSVFYLHTFEETDHVQARDIAHAEELFKEKVEELSGHVQTVRIREVV
jgi:hypothetical protein|tara:strand:+ start:264 stop:425 length:162 start_codon:yes stop_codon:yes gene_type:complete